MSGSVQQDRVALVSVDDESIMQAIINRNVLQVDFVVRQRMLKDVQKVQRRVAQYTELASTV